MNLPFLEWSRTPQGKATGGQWRYALRNSLAMCLALWVAFVLELDEPSWALTSAAVVSFPTVGGVISKSIGRIFGSLMGAAASVAIAGHCLNDPGCLRCSSPHGSGCAPISPTITKTTSLTRSRWRAIPPPSSPSARSTSPIPSRFSISRRRGFAK